jgi:hypothetical protein
MTENAITHPVQLLLRKKLYTLSFPMVLNAFFFSLRILSLDTSTIDKCPIYLLNKHFINAISKVTTKTSRSKTHIKLVKLSKPSNGASAVKMATAN